MHMVGARGRPHCAIARALADFKPLSSADARLETHLRHDERFGGLCGDRDELVVHALELDRAPHEIRLQRVHLHMSSYEQS